MKKLIYTFAVLVFACQAMLAQRIGNLDGINYQAVAIDENGKEIVGMDVEGKPLYEKTIGVRFSILSGSNGPVQYQETHTVLTDKYGLFSLVIGLGAQTGAGQYTKLLDIPWIDANQFLKVEIAIKNDGNYKLVSLQKFMSVPYSFYTDDIADNAITSAKILDSTIVNQDIQTGAIDSRTLLNSSILNEDIADSTINLSTKVTNMLRVANGGTGDSSLMANSLLVGNGTKQLQTLGVATDGQIPIGATGGNPVLANLTAGTGIKITNSPGSITVESTITGGVNSNSNTTVNPGNIIAGTSWLSPTFVLQQPTNLPPVAMGDILIASTNVDMQGCLMNVYLESANSGTAHARVVIFNPGSTNVNLGNGVAVKILVVK